MPLDVLRGPVALGALLHKHRVSALRSVPGEDKPAEQLALANRVLALLREGGAIS